VLLGAGAAIFAGAPSFKSVEPDNAYATLASQSKLGRAYHEWQVEHEKNGGDRRVGMALGWSKGLSTEPSNAKGEIALNLVDGDVSAYVSGLEGSEAADLWLVDNQEGEGKSVMPEAGDKFLRVGTLAPAKTAGTLALTVNLGSALSKFEVDLVVVTRPGTSPVDSRLLTGSPDLFQRLYTQTRTAQLEPKTWSRRVLDLFVKPAQASIDAVDSLDHLVVSGANLFFNETFNGNGRTCGTCHRQEDNLTIDPAFIATLPANDPLFVAEFNPALAQNFEKPQLMRKFGLILENVDGFEDLAHKFVMRGVPHTLALRTSITPPLAGGCGPTNCTPQPIDGTTIPPNQRTGWGGDGAPGSGTLREFAIGAVTQHFTKTLQRRAGTDFRLPTDAELDAMAAFQLFTGRQSDLQLGSIAFPGSPGLRVKGSLAQRGQQVFMNEGGVTANCNICHQNAGATFAVGNANFNTGIENAPQAARQLDPSIPHDGGFGRTPNGGTFGDGTFNIPPLVEAADTGPFFHNNAFTTIEDAVKFYSSAAFNTSPAAISQGFGGINLSDNDSNAVAAFLRVVNALENIRATEELTNFVTANELAPKTADLLTLAMAQTDDALRDLAAPGGNLSAAATHDLNTARLTILIGQANPAGSRGPYLTNANIWLDLARGELQQ
jgi:cytochrome c peroxidase